MKDFIKKIGVFFAILGVFLFCALLMPATPRAKTSLLFAEMDKEKLLMETPSPRMVFVGGSNLSFGLVSQTIKDSLNINPVNTSIHASLGLKYMMENITPYVKNGDIIIISPEYEQFYDGYAWGKEELLRTVIDVSPDKIKDLKIKQISSILPFVPKYAISKFMPSEYFSENTEKGYYLRSSFNKYGDVEEHWNESSKMVEPFSSSNSPIDVNVIEEILLFEQKIENKGATLLITFPCLQESSFKKKLNNITEVENKLRSKGLKVISKPHTYMMHDTLIFNSPYHLTKKGAEIRTKLLVKDIISFQKK